MGLLARWFKGGLSITDMMQMTWEDIQVWHDIYELQATEEEVVSDWSYDKKGKKKKLPSGKRIRKEVLKRIKERKNG